MRRNGVRPHWIRLNSRLTFGHDAFTIGPVTFVHGPFCSAGLRSHENRHVQWCYRTAGLMDVMYLVEFAGRLVYQMATVRAFAPLRAWWWRKVVDQAYRAISWEVDAYAWGAAHAGEFDAVGAP